MYILNDEYLLRKTIVGNQYLFNHKTGEMFDLNETAILILDLCRTMEIDSLIEYICEMYEDVSKADCYDEVIETINLFCDYGILKKAVF